MSRRLSSERMAGWWRVMMEAALVVVLVRKDGKKRPRTVEMGRMIESRWPSSGVGR